MYSIENSNYDPPLQKWLEIKQVKNALQEYQNLRKQKLSSQRSI
jgi:hypothetical protein